MTTTTTATTTTATTTTNPNPNRNANATFFEQFRFLLSAFEQLLSQLWHSRLKGIVQADGDRWRDEDGDGDGNVEVTFQLNRRQFT